MSHRLIRFVALLAAFVLLVGGYNTQHAVAQTQLRFGAIIKTESNEYWATMKKGYEFAAARYGVTVDVGSVPTEADTAQQLALLESYLSKGYDGLLISPITGTNLNSGLAQATAAGIPIINVDELIPLDAAKDAGINISQQIASNNVQAGQLAGQFVLDHVPAGSKVAILEGLAGNPSGQARHDGFAATVQDTLNLVASQPADWDRAKALNVATNILQANPDLAAIYACNDTMALGAMEAVKAAGLQGKVLVLGTDAIPEALDAIKAGDMAGTVAQYPYEIGVLAVENAIKLHEGRPIPSHIDAPIRLLTQENLPQ